MNEPKTLREAIQYFSDAENYREFMVSVLWPDGVVKCPTCGSDNVAYLENAKLYFCKVKHPRQKFSLKVGTIFEDSAIKLEKWLPAFWLLVNCKNGISSYELARAVGVTQKSAWFMLHRIREALKNETFAKLGESGPVEVDETFVGGKVKNMHASKRPRGGGYTGKMSGSQGKAIVMGMLDRNTRQVRAKVIPGVDRGTLQDEILRCIEKKSTIYTDKWRGYESLPEKEFVHETVNHLEEYVRGNVHTNGIENFWSLLKRSLRGTCVAVEPFHLDAYVDEQAFRFNNRATKDNPLTDADRFALGMSQVAGRRLTYAKLTGKDQERPEAF